MEVSSKITYEPPVTEVIEVKAEGIVCQSGGLDPMGDPEDL
jgi:hypothetical protein